jgi:Na+/phosphate symporter
MKDRIKELTDFYSQLDEKGKEEMTTFLESISMKKMSEKEINMWSILIAVLKNQNKDYDHIDNIIGDISDIKEMIKLLD